MKLVVPTITATKAHQFRDQTELIAGISDYAHLDLASSDFNSASELLDYKNTYLEPVLTYSVHLMYKNPIPAVKHFLELPEPPKMIILQAESDSLQLLEAIKLIKDSPTTSLGLAILQKTQPEDISQLILMASQVLIFSGNLGEHGGKADLSLVAKIPEIKKINPDLEIAWDGGINSINISELSKAGVDVFYVGGEIHKSSDPYQKVRELQELAETLA
jgi:pentose-5-phosphate-3-epimerase